MKDWLPTRSLAQIAGKLVDADDRHQQQDDDGVGLGGVIASDGQPEQLADTTAAYRADNGGSAHIDFSTQQRVALTKLGRTCGTMP